MTINGKSKVELGFVIMIFLAVLGQAVLFERRTTTLDERSMSSNEKLDTIAITSKENKTELVGIRVALETQNGNYKLLEAEIIRLKERLSLLEMKIK